MRSTAIGDFPLPMLRQLSPPLEGGARGGPSRRPPSQSRRATENAISFTAMFVDKAEFASTQAENPGEPRDRLARREAIQPGIAPRFSERRRATWSCRILALLGAVLAAAQPAAAQDPVANAPIDALLRLVPSDAAVVLTVEGLREQLHAFNSSRLFAGLKQLPTVKTWIESDKAQQLRRSRDQIETVLGIQLNDICDDLIGDALILALRLPPEAPADSSQARGLLLFQARNRALLERLINAVNEKQQAGGELARVIDREHRGTAYHMREFPPADARPSEWYVTYPDGTFAFSNSESLIQSVIDRKGTKSGAGTAAALRRR